MLQKSFLAAAGLVLASLLSVVHGQALLFKAITIVLPFHPGGTAEASSRIVALQVSVPPVQ